MQLTYEQALRAINALLKGQFDDANLQLIGPLLPDFQANIGYILDCAGVF